MAELVDRFITTVEGKEFDLTLYKEGKKYFVEYNGDRHEVTVDQIDSTKFLFRIDADSSEVDITPSNGIYDIFLEGQDMHARVEPFSLAELRKRAGSALEGPADLTIRAPMPGLVLKAAVAPGDEVRKGETLAIIEAMKMENMIKSPFDGKVKEVFVEPGQAVDKNDKLMELE